MTNEEIAHHLSWICYNPNTNRRDMYAVQLFVEKLVLPDNVTSYARNLLEERIIEFLEAENGRAR
jgi:hypothetical protein